MPSRAISRLRWLTAAVVLVAAVALGWSAYFAAWVASAERPVDLGPYLDNRPPVPANWKTVSLDDICKHVDFPIMKALDLPRGYTLFSCEVDCAAGVVRFTYKRGDAKAVLLLYKKDHPVMHGDRQILQVTLHGKTCQLVRCCKSGRHGISWEVKGTAVSLVCLEDLEDLIPLMVYVDQQLKEQ